MQPYETTDCILQYLYLAINFSKLGAGVSLRLPNPKLNIASINLFLLSRVLHIKIKQTFSTKMYLPISETEKLDESKFIDNSPRNFSQQVEFIKLVLNRNHIALPAIDSFIGSCKLKQFFEQDILDENFISSLIIAKKFIESSSYNINSEKYDYIFVPDTAYLDNSIYRYLNETSDTKFRILNPNGCYFSLFKNESEYEVSDRRLDEVLNTIDERGFTRAASYLTLRLKGKGKDFDSKSAYKGSETDQFSGAPKKVLFLHAIRDANNLYRSDSSVLNPFNSYFEWADFMMKSISSASNQREWYIKIHPSSSLYENDEEIIKKLLSKYGLEEELYKHIPSTRNILAEKMPVFTHSGTIALETAAIGYKSIVIGSRYSDKLVRKVRTHEELYDLIIESSNDKLVEILSEELSKAAVTILYNDFGKYDALALSPSKAVLPNTDPLSFSISNFTSLLSLIANLNKKSALETFLTIASKSTHQS